AIDLVPTTLELMGVPLPPPPAQPADSDFLSGVSLLADIFPPDGPPATEPDVFVDLPAGPYNDARRALIHGDLKLIVSNDARFELYDLAADPGETKNLHKKGDEQTQQMMDRYEGVKAGLREI